MRYLYFKDSSSMQLIEKIRLRLKTIETRPRNVLKSIVGERVGLVVTLSNRKSFLFGYATIGQPVVYKNQQDFMDDYDRHRIDMSSPWFKSHGYGYPLMNPQFTPLTPAPKRVFGNRSYYCA